MRTCIGTVKDTFKDPDTGRVQPCNYVCNYNKQDRTNDCRDLCPDLYQCLLSVAEEELTDDAAPILTSAKPSYGVQTDTASVILLAVLVPVAVILLFVVTGLLVDRLCCKRKKTDQQDSEAPLEEKEGFIADGVNTHYAPRTTDITAHTCAQVDCSHIHNPFKNCVSEVRNHHQAPS